MLFINYFLYFIIYSILGYICEVIYVFILTKKITNRGFLYAPLCPIYGFGALIIIISLKWLYDLNMWYSPILIFILGFILTSSLEYITSVLIELIFHMSFWDYSERILNINGRVCLRNSTLFAILVVIVIYLLNPLFTYLVDIIPGTLKYILFSLLIILFILDTIKHINISKAILKLSNLKLEFDNKKESISNELINKNNILNEKLLNKINNLKKKYPLVLIKIKNNKAKMKIEEFINKINQIKGE